MILLFDIFKVLHKWHYSCLQLSLRQESSIKSIKDTANVVLFIFENSKTTTRDE